jgi:lipopolysaccharide/colanic/teichoic acid biosynthesis glycosyltransferase/glycosyltransferase involved in cell wall biosynthesis
MRVLFVTQYWPPETGAAPARALHFARALERAGHDVRIVTGLPNHPSGRIHPAFAGTGRASERDGGISIERVWLHATPNKTPLTRLWNHLTFAASAMPVALSGPRPDVVLASIPPLFLGLTAAAAAAWHRAPMVLDCRDDWPRAAIALGEMRDGLAARLLSALAGFLQRRAARVLAVTPGMMRQLEARGFDAGRVELITNGADTDLFRPAPPMNGSGRPFTVLYAGTHGLVHGMDALLDAADHLRHRANVRFVLVGDGVAKAALERRAGEIGLANIEFRPSLPPAELVSMIQAADACVATTLDHEFSGETIPVKLFDYFACGRPVVAAVRGDAAAIVTASGAGEVVPPGDGAALAAAIGRLADDPDLCARRSAAGPQFVEREYSRRVIGDRLVSVLEAAHRARHGRPVAPMPRGARGALKRGSDLAVALLLLLALSPVLVLIALAIRFDSRGPSLFRQRRIGRGSSEFRIVKFRTMQVGTPDLASHLMGPASPRVTRLGRLLRRSSLDELPQLWNVLRGEMSLVGPRPALFNQYDLIALRQSAGVDALRPGVTGWAQIHGRDDIPLDLKVEYDRYYLEHVSPALDLTIILRTVRTLFSARGVY